MTPWHPRWPGFEAPGSLALPLPDTHFRSLAPELRLDDGLVLARKREFHVTLFDSAIGARLHEPAAGGAPAQALASVFAGFDWQWRSRGERWLLLEAAAEPPKHSVIELLEMPAFAQFRSAVGALIGEALPATPAHVTLYVAGGQRGIGIRDLDAFERLRLRRL